MWSVLAAKISINLVAFTLYNVCAYDDDDDDELCLLEVHKNMLRVRCF